MYYVLFVLGTQLHLIYLYIYRKYHLLQVFGNPKTVV